MSGPAFTKVELNIPCDIKVIKQLNGQKCKLQTFSCDGLKPHRISAVFHRGERHAYLIDLLVDWEQGEQPLS